MLAHFFVCVMLLGTSDEHSVVVDPFGSVWCFGNNDDGRCCPDNGKKIISSPTRVRGIPPSVGVACGLHYTLSLTVDGDVWCWGRFYGVVGGPKRIVELKNITSMSSGRAHACFIDSFKRVWAMGNNADGECGLGHVVRSENPQLIPLVNDIVSVSCGAWHTLFLTNDGIVFSTGYNNCRIGFPKEIENIIFPTPIPNMPDEQIVKLSGGKYHSLFLSLSNEVYLTGNTYGYNIIPNIPHNIYKPMFVMDNIVHISAGRIASFIDVDGCFWLCGKINEGDNEIFKLSTPTKQSLKNITAISSSAQHVLAMNDEGSLFTFGDNRKIQCGRKDTSFTTTFTTIQLNSPPYLLSGCVLKATNWTQDQIDKITILYKCINHLASPNELNHDILCESQSKGEITIPAPFSSWKEVYEYIQLQEERYNSNHQTNQQKQIKMKESIAELIEEITNTKAHLRNLKVKLSKVQKDIAPIVNSIKHHPTIESCISTVFEPVKVLCVHESKQHDELKKLLSSKSLAELTCKEMKLFLMGMELQNYFPLFVENELDGESCIDVNEHLLVDIGMKRRDACWFLFYRDIMCCKKYFKYQEDSCVVCSHDTVELTLQLLKEYDIVLDCEIIKNHKWSISCLVTCTRLRKIFDLTPSAELQIKKKFKFISQQHVEHLVKLSTNERTEDDMHILLGT